ncbi:hypothetical protein [Vagococcus bubulae]|uniref:hypothetical protein n=1 Tax=Vagococcus bubulae TaxID=1977868 RepID=UPI001A9E6109|nr:hypothetical protein [Vagococcus bubulae]
MKKYGYISVVPDSNNSFYRVRNGEMGLVEGVEIAKKVNEWIDEDKEKEQNVQLLLSLMCLARLTVIMKS